MDSETAKALIPILATIVGALIASLSGWVVARDNQQVQRAIAKDNARRDDLKGLLSPLRARVVERAALLESARGAAHYSWEVDDESDAATSLRAHRAIEAVSDRSDLYQGDWTASGSAEVTARYREWRDAEAACCQLIGGIVADGPHEDYTGAKARATWAAFDAATVALTSAINETIHGDALIPIRPARRGIPARLAGVVHRNRHG